MARLWPFLERIRSLWPLVIDFATSGCYEWGPVERVTTAPAGTRSLQFRAGRLSPAALALLTEHPLAAAGQLDLWLLGLLLAEGPKVFRPTVAQCLALEQIELRLSLDDYAQPFPVMAIELPTVYAAERPSQGTDLDGQVTPQVPELITVAFWSPATVAVSVMFSSGKSIVGCYHARAGGVIEDWQAGIDYAGSDPAAEPIHDDEARIVALCRRVALNSMLLLMDQGCRRLGPDDPGYAARLERYAQNARRSGRDPAQADCNRRAYPVTYGLERPIVLHQEERPLQAVAGEPTGRSARPHWRRGHWRMQGHGPRQELRKRILIKPVLVNRSRLGTESLPTPATTYTISE